jgi:hypothetical protein
LARPSPQPIAGLLVIGASLSFDPRGASYARR